MSDRSRSFCVAAITSFVLIACGPGSDDEQLCEFADHVLEELYISENYEEYMHSVDHSTDMDSTRMDMVMMMHKQFADFQRQKHGDVEDVHMVNATKEGDSIRYVHYEITYADSTKETAMMKVIRTSGGWMIRSRN